MSTYNPPSVMMGGGGEALDLIILGAALLAVGLAIWATTMGIRRSRKGEASTQWFLLAIASLLALFPLSNWPVHEQPEGPRSQCISNLHRIGVAANMYLDENDDRMPPGRKWMQALRPYVDGEANYKCPSFESPYGYSLNVHLDGVKVPDDISSDALVLAFDGPGGRNALGYAKDMQFRHGGNAPIVFLDSHATTFNRNMRWWGNWTLKEAQEDYNHEKY